MHNPMDSMFGLGTTELLIILLVGVLVFGASRLPALGRGLGEAMRGFRDSLRGDDNKSSHAGEISDGSDQDTDSKPPVA